MVKDFTKAMKLYVLAHIGLGLIYYLFYSFLLINEKPPLEVSKNMLIAFTIINVLVFFLSNQLNQEKTRSNQMKSEYFFYALIASELIMAFVAFGILGK